MAGGTDETFVEMILSQWFGTVGKYWLNKRGLSLPTYTPPIFGFWTVWLV
jgi:hypothetical protein